MDRVMPLRAKRLFGSHARGGRGSLPNRNLNLNLGSHSRGCGLATSIMRTTTMLAA